MQQCSFTLIDSVSPKAQYIQLNHFCYNVLRLTEQKQTFLSLTYPSEKMKYNVKLCLDL